MRIEYWKPIPGYFELYEVSSFGRVRSINRYVTCCGGKIRFYKSTILKYSKTKGGYPQVHLSKEGNVKSFLIHRLVYETFNGTIPEGYDVNHINEVKTDNRLENLNLMTRRENNNWGTHNRRASETKSQPLFQLTYPEGKFIKEWSSAREAGRNGFDQSAVSACCRGERKQYKGFIWVKKSPLC